MQVVPTSDLTVTTWNVLADAFTVPERYQHVSADLLSATNRFPRITTLVDAMLEVDDVVVLQEVEPRLWSMTVERLGGRVQTHLFARHATRPDGVALFSRHRSRSQIETVVLQRAVVVATFELGTRHVHVATTHLPHRDTPRRPAAIMSAVLDELPDGPAVLALDANAPWSGPVCAPARDRGWTSQATEPSGYWSGEWLDTDLVAVRHAAVQCRRGAMVSAPPNASWPSDHLPISGVVTLA